MRAKWSNVMLGEAKHLAAFASRFLAALGMTTFNIPPLRQYAKRSALLRHEAS
jgi:hypothetical protein